MVNIKPLHIYIYIQIYLYTFALSLSNLNLSACPPMAQIEWISTRGKADVISARLQGSGSTRSAPWSSPNMIRQDSVGLPSGYVKIATGSDHL